MKRNLTGTIATTVVLLALGPAAVTAPKPAEVPTSWQLDFEYEKPQAIRVRLPGDAAPRVYWYMLYTVTNDTGDDRIFVPGFTLYTETGQILRAGQDTPSRVFEKIKRIHNEPLLKDLTAMTGKLLQGEDNARMGAAIWPDFDPRAGSFDIFVGGLSGESEEIDLPVPVTVEEMDPLTGQMQELRKSKVVLSKTLRLRYSVTGEAAARVNAPVRRTEQAWIMR